MISSMTYEFFIFLTLRSIIESVSTNAFLCNTAFQSITENIEFPVLSELPVIKFTGQLYPTGDLNTNNLIKDSNHCHSEKVFDMM